MTIKDTVYNYISEQITRGNLQRDAHLTEQSLADNLGMSRTPIREALLQLAADNILVRQPHKGFKIKFHTQKDVEELYTLIGLLDGKIAALTTDLLTEEDYALMRFLITSMDSAIDNHLFVKYNELQEQFHEVYLKKCPNQLLLRDLNNKKKSFVGKNYERIHPDTIDDLLRATNREHQTILQLFKDHEPEKLRNFIEDAHWSPQNSQYDAW